jgi:hypothetical protein
VTRRASAAAGLATLAVAAVLSTPAVGSSQTPVERSAPAERPARGNRPALAPSNAELATILDAYAIVQAQNALQLNDEQYGRFVSRLKRLQDIRRRYAQARNRLVQELRKLTADPSTDEALIRERLKALRDVEQQSAEAVRREYDNLDEVLDPRQQVRFRVFEEQLERRKLDLLIRARARAARGQQDADK